VVQGSLKERPLPRLLQLLFRKKFTGYVVVTDQTRDESEVYLREGAPVHVRRPVDTDRLDNLLVEYGVVSPEVVAAASAEVSEGHRLGDVLERRGVLDRKKLANVLKMQVMRKLTRLFFVTEGSYSIFAAAHAYGEGDDLALMRVDPRSVIYPGIRAAYDLPRVTQELARLMGQRFRLNDISPGFVAAMGIPAEDRMVAALRQGWMTLDDLDSMTSRPLEVRSVVLALYYTDSLAREPIGQPTSDSAIPSTVFSSPSSDPDQPFRFLGDSGPNWRAQPPAAERSSSVPSVRAPFASAAARPQARAVSAPPPKAPAAAQGGQFHAPDPVLRASIQDMAQKVGRLTHFELLGVSANASAAEISTAFVRAARQFHPDRLTGAGLRDLYPLAEKILARINEAAMVLGDPARRAEYVALLSAGPQVARTNLPTVLEAENTFLKGEVFLKKGDYAKAIECFTAAHQANPSEPQYRAYLAWARFDDPRARKEAVVRETLSTLESVLRERPKFVRGHHWVGRLCKFLNESDRAAQAFRHAVELDSSFIEASRELRLLEMRKTKSMPTRSGAKPEPPRGGGLMGKFFKK
jgi:tetratricopeptide (TPR) repeat protein